MSGLRKALHNEAIRCRTTTTATCAGPGGPRTYSRMNRVPGAQPEGRRAGSRSQIMPTIRAREASPSIALREAILTVQDGSDHRGCKSRRISQFTAPFIEASTIQSIDHRCTFFWRFYRVLSADWGTPSFPSVDPRTAPPKKGRAQRAVKRAARRREDVGRSRSGFFRSGVRAPEGFIAGRSSRQIRPLVAGADTQV